MAVGSGQLAASLRVVRRSDLLGAIGMSLLPNDQCDSTENSYGRQYQAPGYGLTEKNDATQGRNDWNAELQCSGMGSFQRR